MRRSALLAAAVLGLAGAVAAYGYYGANVRRWGCPSQAELERPRAPRDVVGAFESRGIELVRTALPRTLPRRARAYRDAVLYRNATPDAAVFVLVCTARCAVSSFRFERHDGRAPANQRFRMGFVLGNNVAAWITDDDGRSAAWIAERIGPALTELDVAVSPGSRCYIA